MGQSYGKWDGDTLVVEVTGLLPSTWFDRSGNHHCDQMKVTERYTLVTARITSSTRPRSRTRWSSSSRGRSACRSTAVSSQDAQLMDFRCVEFVEELLFGEWRRNPLPRPLGTAGESHRWREIDEPW